MRCIGNRLHFIEGEMRLQAPALLRQYAAGRGDLDHVGTILAGQPHLRRAFHHAGAGEAGIEQFVDLGPEAVDVGMAADDRQRRASGHDARAGHHSFGSAAPQGKGGGRAAARFAHGGKAGARGDQGVLGADDHAPFVRLGRFLPEIAARIAGQVGVEVNQAGQHGFGREVDFAVGCDASRKGAIAGGDRDDLAIGDDNGGRAAWLAACIGDHAACTDRHGFGGERRGDYRRHHRRTCHQHLAHCLHGTHLLLPCFSCRRLMRRALQQGKACISIHVAFSDESQ